MIRKFILPIFLTASFFSNTLADQVAIQADIIITDDCPDYTTWNSRALITEHKKLNSDIFLYYLGQAPSALLACLCGAGAIGFTYKAATDWGPFALLGTVACAGFSPAFVALYLSLENKKILAHYNIEEIDEQLAMSTDALITA